MSDDDGAFDLLCSSAEDVPDGDAAFGLDPSVNESDDGRGGGVIYVVYVILFIWGCR